MRKGKFVGLACLLLISILTLCACSGGLGGNDGNEGPNTSFGTVPGFSTYNISYNSKNNSLKVNTIPNDNKSVLTKQFYSENTSKDARLQEIYENIYEAAALKVKVSYSDYHEFEVGFTNGFCYFKNYQELGEKDAYVFDIKDKGYLTFLSSNTCFISYGFSENVKEIVFEAFDKAITAISLATYSSGDTYTYTSDGFDYEYEPWNYEVKTWPNKILIDATYNSKEGNNEVVSYSITNLNDDSCFSIPSNSYTLDQFNELNRNPIYNADSINRQPDLYISNKKVSIGNYHTHRPANQLPCTMDTCKHSYSCWFDYDMYYGVGDQSNLIKYRYCPLCGNMEFTFEYETFDTFPHFNTFDELLNIAYKRNHNAVKYEFDINGKQSTIIKRGNVIEIYNNNKKLVLFGYKDNAIIYEEDLTTNESRFYDLSDKAVYDEYLETLQYFIFEQLNDYLERIKKTNMKELGGDNTITSNEISATNTYYDQENENANVKDVFNVKIAEDCLNIELNKDHLDKVNNELINSEKYKLKISYLNIEDRVVKLVGKYDGIKNCNDIVINEHILPIESHYISDFAAHIDVVDAGDSYKLNYVPQVKDQTTGMPIGDIIKSESNAYSFKYDLSQHNLLYNNYTIKVNDYENQTETTIKAQENIMNINMNGQDLVVFDLMYDMDNYLDYLSVAKKVEGNWVEDERIITNGNMTELLQYSIPIYALLTNFNYTQNWLDSREEYGMNSTIASDYVLLLHKGADGKYSFIAHHIDIDADIENNIFTITLKIWNKGENYWEPIKEYEISDIGATQTFAPKYVKKTEKEPAKKVLLPFKDESNRYVEYVDFPYSGIPGIVKYHIVYEKFNYDKFVEIGLDRTVYGKGNEEKDLIYDRYIGETDTGYGIYDAEFINFYGGIGCRPDVFRWYKERPAR